MHNVCEVDRVGEGVERRDENSSEDSRLFTWKLRTDTSSLSPLLVSIQLESPPVPGGGQLLRGEVNVILPLFQVLDFELTPEDMKAIDGLNRNRRYYEFLP